MSSEGGAQSGPPSGAQPGPPYPPTTASTGGTPDSTDQIITSIFLCLFIMGAATHMTILQLNLQRGKKFIMSGLLFGFCMARIVTCTMRLVWSTHLTNVSVAIAAQIFVQAGVILLFIVNLIWTQRIMRATHPRVGGAKALMLTFKLYYASIVVMLAALITCTVQSFYTLGSNTRRIDRDVQLVGSTYFTVGAFAPTPLILVCLIVPRKARLDKFGEGKWRSKIAILLFSSVILTLGAAFRSGTSYVPRPRNNPAWYHSKACFYIFNFTIEIIVVALYAIIRVDKRFHGPYRSEVPSGESQTASAPAAVSADENEKKPSLLDIMLDEEQVFDDDADTRIGSPAEKPQPADVETGLARPEAQPVDMEKGLTKSEATH